MVDRKDILDLLKSKKIQPLNRQELSLHFRLSGREKNKFYDLLRRLESRGEIIRVKGGRYALPPEPDLVTGILEVNPRGFGFVRPEAGGKEDIYVRGENMSVALHGDKVLVSLLRERGRGPAGKVVRILKRGKKIIVGTLARSDRRSRLIPDNPAIIRDIYLDRSKTKGARPGDKVAVRIINWSSPYLNPEGETVEILGKAGEPAVDVLAVIREYDLSRNYPASVRREAEKIIPGVTTAEREGREDLRGKTVFTIDPDDARDFDDAVSLEKLGDGNWLLGVHVSDVSHYVRTGSALDVEARRRGTSVYFPARALHMLPPALATAVCSLKPEEERLTQSLFLTLSPRGDRLQARFTPSVIRSKKRLTYGEVSRIVVDRDETSRREAGEVTPILDDMARLAQTLRNLRFARGAFDLELPEEKIIFDRKGLITAIELEGEDLAHAMIEEFMLAANEALAELLIKKEVPLLYRVHAPPDGRDLKEFSEFAVAFGFNIRNPRNRREIQALLDSVKGKPLGYTIQTAFLRSLKRAEYAAENIGHYGLALRCYTYFTSPIRRYPDLYNHRLLKRVLRGEKSPPPLDLEKLALHCSETEQVATEVEREILLLRKLQFFRQKLDSDAGAVFQGVITAVKNFGLKIYLNRYLIGGLVHVSSLTDGFYRLDRTGTRLVDRRSKREFRVGDLVEVEVEEVDLVKREVSFKIVPEKRF